MVKIASIQILGSLKKKPLKKKAKQIKLVGKRSNPRKNKMMNIHPMKIEC